MRELLNYPQTDAEKIDIVKGLINSIAENPNGNISCELNELNRITGKNYRGIEFAEYWGWTDLDTLAENALTPEPPCVRNLTKAEIKEIVSILKISIISDDNKAEYYTKLLQKSLPLSEVLKYIRLEDDEETITNNLLQAASSSVIEL